MSSTACHASRRPSGRRQHPGAQPPQRAGGRVAIDDAAAGRDQPRRVIVERRQGLGGLPHEHGLVGPRTLARRTGAARWGAPPEPTGPTRRQRRGGGGGPGPGEGEGGGLGEVARRVARPGVSSPASAVHCWATASQNARSRMVRPICTSVDSPGSSTTFAKPFSSRSGRRTEASGSPT